MISLKDYNSFGVDHSCQNLIVINDVDKATTYYSPTSLIVGGGSNILFRQDFDGSILINKILGKEIIFENEDEVHVRFGGGENWHECVLWCINNDFGGIENLSLIPGSMGAAPIQNIGAYGVELKDVFVNLEGIHLGQNILSSFDFDDCNFSYRNSIFKNALKGKYFITHVVLRLTKKSHRVNTRYGNLDKYLIENSLDNSNIKDISQAVINIRNKKLPNPCILGNSGSFFKNPIISEKSLQDLRIILPEIDAFSMPGNEVKISAAYLIEQAGWKGKRKGDTGVYEQHALVLVNYGNASGADVWALAEDIARDVYKLYSIILEPEVNVVPPIAISYGD